MSVFTYIALGIGALTQTGLATLATIMAATYFVVGSAIIPGNIFLLPNSGTTTNPGLYVGTTKVLGLTGAGLIFSNSGTQTGVTLFAQPATSSGVSVGAPLAVKPGFWTVCSGTGGLAKYPYCLVESPYSTTGAITNIELHCGNTDKVLLLSGGLVKTSTQGVGVFTGGLIRLNDISVGTGSIARASLTGGVIAWNPADSIKFQTITTPQSLANGGGNDCAVYVESHDKFGS